MALRLATLFSGKVISIVPNETKIRRQRKSWQDSTAEDERRLACCVIGYCADTLRSAGLVNFLRGNPILFLIERNTLRAK